jgi:N-acetylmuramoyl-L-alanine amidase
MGQHDGWWRHGGPGIEAASLTMPRCGRLAIWTSVIVMAGALSSCGTPHPQRTTQLRAIPHALAGSPKTQASSDLTSEPGLASTADAESTPARIPEPIREEAGDWVDLGAWARLETGIELRSLSSARVSWQLRSPEGVLELIGQSRIARYEGVELWLGYAPMLGVDGLRVHRVDLEKNIRPLLLDAAWPPSTARRIVIDPGHGGAQPGTRSVLGAGLEKDYTLDWALRLAPLLTAAGWEVTLTRTNDVELSLTQRVAVADAVDADLFLSLHFNSAGSNRQRSGIETYCLTPAGLPSTLVRDGTEDPGYPHPNNGHDTANLRYAVHLHRALIRATGAADCGIRRARFMGVLRPQQRAAVLIEGGFLSNPEEAARIADPAYRQHLAEAVAQALSRRPLRLVTHPPSPGVRVSP